MKTKDELTKKYLKSGANYCPFCESENITAGECDFNYTNAWRTVLCKHCKKQWTEIFEIVKIEEDTEENAFDEWIGNVDLPQ